MSPSSENPDVFQKKLSKSMREHDEHFIKTCFERAFTTEESGVTAIMSTLKTKAPKWDMKEKCKKQEQVIIQLKAMLDLYAQEAKGLHESCVDHDIATNKLLKDCAEKIATWHGDIKVFRATENKMIVELREVQKENSTLKSDFEVYKAINGPLIAKAQDAQRHSDEANDRLYKEEMKSIQLKAECDRCQRELMELKAKFDESLRLQKEQLDQVILLTLQFEYA